MRAPDGQPARLEVRVRRPALIAGCLLLASSPAKAIMPSPEAGPSRHRDWLAGCAARYRAGAAAAAQCDVEWRDAQAPRPAT
ncbi:hypothetical protein BTO02_28055 [Paraburkholderia sp. SOS3]|nr:hypothetical protein BTO02_28055 [Paraburkholderia sp. SOS3]